MKHILNQYFDKIYCITVHNFTDRHEFITTNWKGIDFEWMLSLPPQFLHPIGDRNQEETSIILGHMACIWNAKIRGFKKIAVIEDDTKIIVTEEEMKKFFNEIPDNWDFLYMSNPSWTAGIWDSWDTWTSPYSEYARKIRWGNSCSFNGIQSHMFEPLTNLLTEGKEPVDFSYFKLFGQGNNSFCPVNFFGDTFSTPHESVKNKFDLTKFIPSRISHSF